MEKQGGKGLHSLLITCREDEIEKGRKLQIRGEKYTISYNPKGRPLLDNQAPSVIPGILESDEWHID